MTEDENLVLAKVPERPSRHFFDIADHPLGGDGRGDLGRIGEEICFAGSTLVPLDDRKILFQSTSEPPAHWNRDVTRPAMDVEQHGIPAIRAADRHPLVDSAYLHFLKPFYSIRRQDLASIGDDCGRLGTVGGLR